MHTVTIHAAKTALSQLLWWLAGDKALSVAARTAIASEANDLFVSAAFACEITTKHRLGRLPGVAGIVADLYAVIADQNFIALSISLRHGQVTGALRARIATRSTAC
jgi:PIN domain nuclease of toxin-antitoxin system